MTQGLTPGTVVRRDLTVLREIGTGGYATVYAVRSPAAAGERALKILHEQYLADAAQIQRFVREAELLSRLRSPLLPRIYDVGQLESKLWYMLMELLDGETLADVLKRERRFAWRHVASIGIDVCDALSAAHAIGALHRDLKPHNLMLTRDQNIKVLDFGVATYVAGRTDRFGSLTRPNSAVGTPEYMSPELVLGHPLGPACDIYMLGVVLYELLTGVRPFTGENLGAILGAITAGRYAPARSLAPDAPLAILGIVEKAMRLEPERRFESAADMAVALRQALAEPDVPTSPSLAPGPRHDDETETLASGRLSLDVTDVVPVPSPAAAPPPAPPAHWARVAGIAAGAVGLGLLAFAIYGQLSRAPRSAPAPAAAVERVEATATPEPAPATAAPEPLPTGALPPEDLVVATPEPEEAPRPRMTSRRPAKRSADTTNDLISMTGLADPFGD